MQCGARSGAKLLFPIGAESVLGTLCKKSTNVYDVSHEMLVLARTCGASWARNYSSRPSASQKLLLAELSKDLSGPHAVLTAKITNAANAFSLEELLLENRRQLNVINCAAALTRIAQLSTPAKQADEKARDVLELIRNVLFKQAIRPRDCCTLAYAYAKHGIRSEALFRRISTAVLDHVDEFTPVDVSQMIWSFATVQYQDKGIILVLIQRALALMPLYQGRTLTNVVWSVATLQHKSDRLFHVAAPQLLKHKGYLSPQHVSNILWAYAKSDVYSSELFDGMIEVGLPMLNRFEPNHLSKSCWALAKMGHGSEATTSWFQGVEPLVTKLQEPQHIVTVLWAVAKLGIKEDKLWNALIAKLQAQLHLLQPQDIFMAARAVSQAGWASEEVVAGLIARGVECLQDAKPEFLVQLLALCGQYKHINHDFLLAAQASVSQQLGKFSDAQLARVVVSLSAWENHDEVLIRQWADKVSCSQDHVDPRLIAWMNVARSKH